MRADRLVSLIMLLRQRGQMTAAAIAEELGVTQRTVLRDIEALSASGVPVYSERGRRGGFALLPGFQAQLAGLTYDETIALLVASASNGQAFGLGSALSSAVRKIIDALPPGHRLALSDAERRLLVDPDADVIVRRDDAPAPDLSATAAVRRAVLEGCKLTILYAAPGDTPSWRTLDPVGLVVVDGREYLVALRSGAERTYRLSRVVEARALDEPADRPGTVDLERLWRERCAEYLDRELHRVTVNVEVVASRHHQLVGTALAVRAATPEHDGWARLDVTWPDVEHAEFALWQLGADARAVEPTWLRERMRTRGAQIAEHYGSSDVLAVG